MTYLQNKHWATLVYRSHMALNRQYFCECKSQNKSLIRKKNRRCEMMKLDKLEQLRHSKPRYVWKYFNNKSNANSADSIPLNIFHNYFLNLENELFQTVNDDVNSVRLKGFVSDICIILTTYNLCHIIYDYFCSNSLPSKAQWKRDRRTRRTSLAYTSWYRSRLFTF